MKSILMSIRPEWCKKIFDGEKTIEVRKTRPLIDMPFKVLVYCTKAKNIREDGLYLLPNDKELYLGCKEKDLGFVCWEGDFRNGKVIGSFVCDRVDEFDSEWSEYAYACAPTDIPCAMPMSEENAIKICKEKGCMTLEDIIDYFGDEEWRAYFWHITEPQLFEKPKEFREFRSIKCTNKNGSCSDCKIKPDCIKYLTHPPRTWCYVEGE